MPHLEITKVVLVHCNIVNNDYQQDSRVLYRFVPNKPFGILSEISPTNHAIKTASKRAIQKTAEATGDLIGNEIADKMKSVSKKMSAKASQNNETEEDVERATPKKDTYLPQKENKLLKN